MAPRLLFPGVLLMVIAFGRIAPAGVISDFDSDLDGWTEIGSGRLSHSATAGNPLGFARFDDVPGAGGDGFLVAPAKFLGNWSALNGNGVLKWHHIIVSLGDAAEIVNASATIAGPGGNATYLGGPHQTTWTTFSAPINSGSWVVNTGTWNAILADGLLKKGTQTFLCSLKKVCVPFLLRGGGSPGARNRMRSHDFMPQSKSCFETGPAATRSATDSRGGGVAVFCIAG